MKTIAKTSLLFILATGLTACHPTPSMQIEIRQRRSLPEIPSASGIEKTGQGIFVMGDDSEHLFQLGEDLSILNRFRVASQSPPPGSQRIPKPDKLDFEAMTALPDGRLMLFGSGSKSPQRDSVAIIQPSNGDVQHFSIALFYGAIKIAAQLPEGAFNIEAAAIHEGHIYLFNRGMNLMAHCPLDALLAHLKTGANCPVPKVQYVELPPVNGTTAAFSGATGLPGTGLALFTATVEFTDNWLDDGEVGGSWIGYLPFRFDGLTPNRPVAIPIKAPQGDWNIKIESVTVTKNPAPGIYHLLLVTDSDDGASEIIDAVLRLDNSRIKE